MLIAPLLVGTVIALVYEGPSEIEHRSAIPLSRWHGLWAISVSSLLDCAFKARAASRKAEYAKPMIAYGICAALAGVVALVFYPGLAW